MSSKELAVFGFEGTNKNMAHWLSWLERRPVTAEVVGSSPSWVAFGVLAQLGEHLPYKQRVIGSSPIGPTYLDNFIIVWIMGRFPSGQRGQTVNLLATPSVVRIHLCPFHYRGVEQSGSSSGS